jgi:hypothetical protein
MIKEPEILVTSFARVGFSGDFGGTYFLTKLVGSAKRNPASLDLIVRGRGHDQYGLAHCFGGVYGLLRRGYCDRTAWPCKSL